MSQSFKTNLRKDIFMNYLKTFQPKETLALFRISKLFMDNLIPVGKPLSAKGHYSGQKVMFLNH